MDKNKDFIKNMKLTRLILLIITIIALILSSFKLDTTIGLLLISVNILTIIIAKASKETDNT